MNPRLRLSYWTARWRVRPQRLLLAVRRRAAARRARRLQPSVQHARAALLAFDATTKDEFIHLSECLAPLAGQLAEMADQAAQLDRLLQNRDADQAYTSAFDLYKRSVDLAHASIGISLTQEEELESLEGSLLQNQNRFARNSLMFRTLVLSIRAEASRIDAENQSVFISVAAEMAAMERAMSDAVARAFGELSAIVAEASSGRAELQKLQHTLHENARRSVLTLRAGLDELKRELLPCAQANQRIVGLLAEARARTGEIITALQYQDIVRQQLEHVESGFGDIAGALAPEAPRRAVDLGYLHDAARLQQAQLRRSRHTIEQASGEITRAGALLLEIGRQFGSSFDAMEQTARAVIGDTTLSGLLQDETERLVAIASHSESTNDRIARLLDRIEESVHNFSNGIRWHEFDVQLVALNAQIVAARVPHAGALNKLAEETSRLAVDTAELTRATTEQLATTLHRLRDMRRDADKVRATIGREKAELADGARSVSTKLDRLHERVQHSSSELMERFDTAYRGVDELLGALQFPAQIDACYAPSESLCTELIVLSAGIPRDPTSPSDRLSVHNLRYTMREEREIHASALGRETSPAHGAEVDLFTEVQPETSAPATSTPAGAQPVETSLTPAGEVELF